MNKINEDLLINVLKVLMENSDECIWKSEKGKFFFKTTIIKQKLIDEGILEEKEIKIK